MIPPTTDGGPTVVPTESTPSVVRGDASKKCNEAGGAQDSIDDDDVTTKKSNKRKCAPRSLAPDGPKRRNPARLCIAVQAFREMDDEDDNDEVGKQSEHLIAVLGDDSVVHCTVVVAAEDASKKCKEAGGAQDSIDDDDDVDDADDDFEAGDCDHEVHCTIKDIDILTKRKNSGDKIDYKNHGGNIWLKQLCQDKVEEYCNIVGNHEKMRKNIFVTTIIKQLANENRRVLKIRNGEWAQLKEPEVRRNILVVMGNAKRKMNIKTLVVPVLKKKFWKGSEEKSLRDWYIK
jgi:hypothetical protein